MLKDVGDILFKPEKYNKAVYNSSSRYAECPSLDFQDQLYPRMLDHFLKTCYSHKEFVYTTFFDTLEIEGPYEKAIITLGNIILYAFECGIREADTSFTCPIKHDLAKLNNRKDIIGALATIGKYAKTEDSKRYLNGLIAFFKYHPSTVFQLRKAIPRRFADKMTEMLQNYIRETGQFFENKILMDCASKYKFIPAKDAVKDFIPMHPNVKLLPTKSRLHLVIHDLKFDEISQVFFEKTIGSQAGQLLFDTIIYDNCYFDSQFEIMSGALDVRVLFKNCIFNEHFSATKVLFQRLLRFENCKFLNGLFIQQCTFETAFYLEDCTFYKGREVKLKRCTFEKHYPGHFSIQNCTFHCPVSFQSSNAQGELRIEDTAFFDIFDFTNFKFVPEQAFLSNILFNKGRDIKKYERILVDILNKHSQFKIAEKLGISDVEVKKTNLFDYDTYQIAYDSGFLKPEYAAYFLGKSKVYLAKKRTEDKKKLVRDSIPFKVDGKDIQYPVEALLAFKAKDWEKLKELRKKYPIPTK